MNRKVLTQSKIASEDNCPWWDIKDWMSETSHKESKPSITIGGAVVISYRHHDILCNVINLIWYTICHIIWPKAGVNKHHYLLKQSLDTVLYDYNKEQAIYEQSYLMHYIN